MKEKLSFCSLHVHRLRALRVTIVNDPNAIERLLTAARTYKNVAPSFKTAARECQSNIL